MIVVINPSKTLQKPLEAILKPSKGFSFSAAHQRARTQSRGSTLTACGRATLDGVKRHPHPRGCSSFRVAPSGSAEDGERGKAPNLGQGTSPLWGVGATPRLGGIGSGATFAGRSPLAPCKGKVPNPRSGWCNLLHQLTYGVLRATLGCSKQRHGRLAEGRKGV